MMKNLILPLLVSLVILGCSNEENITFNLNSDTTIKPIFNQTGEYYLNIDLEGKGTYM